MKLPIILASASPRRKELLSRITENFTIRVSDVDETLPPMDPEAEVLLLSQKKAAKVFGETEGACLIIGADTIVVTEEGILGKPKNPEDAVRMLNLLSGKTHRVMTGVSLFLRSEDGREEHTSFAETSLVRFRPLTEEEILAYTESGEPMDKAGAYAIQGGGGAFVEELQGSLENVIGLPVQRLEEELRARHLLP